MARVLIIAYGNPMRSDDGLAWHAADELEGKWSSSEVEILRVHQLAPELAENVSRSEGVIFVDAAMAEPNCHPGEVRVAEIGLPQGAPRFSHQLSPAAVMALASQLYGVTPRAFAVTLTADCFEHGEALSPVVAAAIPALVARIEERIQSLLSSKPFTASFPADSAKL
jgi:hydrogenase maturation protease